MLVCVRVFVCVCVCVCVLSRNFDGADAGFSNVTGVGDEFTIGSYGECAYVYLSPCHVLTLMRECKRTRYLACALTCECSQRSKLTGSHARASVVKI